MCCCPQLVNVGEDVLLFYNDKTSFQALIDLMRSERHRLDPHSPLRCVALTRPDPSADRARVHITNKHTRLRFWISSSQAQVVHTSLLSCVRVSATLVKCAVSNAHQQVTCPFWMLLQVPHQPGDAARLLHRGQERVHRDQVPLAAAARRHRARHVAPGLSARGERLVFPTTCRERCGACLSGRSSDKVSQDE